MLSSISSRLLSTAVGDVVDFRVKIVQHVYDQH